jgi:hypothetical protein
MPKPTSKTINRKYKALCDKQAKLNEAFAKFRDEVVANGVCDHSSYFQYSLDRGDGYGRMYKRDYRTCNICGQKFFSQTGSWVPYKDEDMSDPWKD